MKAGTTSLFRYLQSHPHLTGSQPKEPNVFIDKNWHQGIAQYAKVFPENSQCRFEASTNYTKFPIFKHVPARMYQALPDIRLVYIVRHPVNRIVSQLHHVFTNKRISRLPSLNTDAFWQTRGKNAILTSKYAIQVRQYLEYYNRSQIYLLRFEDLVRQPVSELNKLCIFLDIDHTFFTSEMQFTAYNASERKVRPTYKFKRFVESLTNVNKPSQLPSVQDLLRKPIPRPELSAARKQWLWTQVKDDVDALERMFNTTLHYHSPE